MIFITIIIFLLLYLFVKRYESCDDYYDEYYDECWEDNQSSKSKLGIFCICILIFLSGFRHLGVGVDTAYYVYSLKESSNTPFSEILSTFYNGYFSATNETKDPGFSILEKIFSLFTTNSTVYLLCIGTTFLVFLRKFFTKYTSSSWELCFAFIVYLTLFFGYLPNAAIRQSIALIFLLYVYTNFHEQNRIKSILLIIIGSIMHQSILAGLIIILFPLIRNVKLYYIVCGILYGCMFVIGNVFATYITSFSDVYSAYAMSDYYSDGNAKPYNFVIFMFIIYMIGLVFINDEDHLSQNSFLYKLLGIAMVLTPLILIQPNFQRFTAIFAIGICVFLPKCLTLFSPFIRRLAYTLLILVFMYMTYNSQYKFNWEEMELHDRYLFIDINTTN